MLDNSVAGGIAGGTSVLDTIVKEAAEEASLDPELVRKRARAVGAVSYYRQTDAGWLQPEVEYVYDMRLEPGETQLIPRDEEVESFKVRVSLAFVFVLSLDNCCCWRGQLMSVDDIVPRMHAGEFKPNCALGASSFSRSSRGLHSLCVAASPNRFFGTPRLL